MIKQKERRNKLVENKKKLYASIDLGSNTFHILIAEGSSSSSALKTIFKQRDYVFLSQNGVDKIDQDRYDLGIQTLLAYRKIIDEYGVENYKVIGTETLRLASNGPSFVSEALEKSRFKIDIIDGLQEANYIYEGVNAYLGEIEGTQLIMDIGGGSVEFIVFDKESKRWAHSFPIGISVLFNNFQDRDPIRDEDLDRLKEFLDTKTNLLREEVSKYNIQWLIGSAGSFEILQEMMKHRSKPESNKIKAQELIDLYQEIIVMDYDQRKNIPGLPIERVKLMPMALSLLVYVVKTLQIKEIVCSPYSLKEGVIFEMIRSKSV